jgi:hypothetical protein
MISTNDDKDKEIERLRQENAAKDKIIAEKELRERDLEQALAKQADIIARAKNISSVLRPSLSRVKRLCDAASLDVEKVQGGYQLSLGFTLKRVFKKLSQIFDILVSGNWYLSDLFNPDFFAPNKYECVSPNSSFNNSVDSSRDDSSSVPQETLVSFDPITGLAVGFQQLSNQGKQLIQKVDKYRNLISQKLSSVPFADSYTDETLNQAQNSYNTLDESLDDFSPA